MRKTTECIFHISCVQLKSGSVHITFKITAYICNKIEIIVYKRSTHSWFSIPGKTTACLRLDLVTTLQVLSYTGTDKCSLSYKLSPTLL